MRPRISVIILAIFSFIAHAEVFDLQQLETSAPVIHDINAHQQLIGSVTLKNTGAQPLQGVQLHLASNNSKVSLDHAHIFVARLNAGEVYQHFFEIDMQSQSELFVTNCTDSGLNLSFKKSFIHANQKTILQEIKEMDVLLDPTKKGLCNLLNPSLPTLNKKASDKVNQDLGWHPFQNPYTKVSDYWLVILLAAIFCFGVYRARQH